MVIQQHVTITKMTKKSLIHVMGTSSSIQAAATGLVVYPIVSAT
jgi:hypothetical protein